MEQHSPFMSQCPFSESTRKAHSPQNRHSFPEKHGRLGMIHELWCCIWLPIGKQIPEWLIRRCHVHSYIFTYFQVGWSVWLRLSDAHMPCWNIHMQMMSISASQWMSEKTALCISFPCDLLLVSAILKDACFNEQETEAVLLQRRKILQSCINTSLKLFFD